MMFFFYIFLKLTKKIFIFFTLKLNKTKLYVQDVQFKIVSEQLKHERSQGMQFKSYIR